MDDLFIESEDFSTSILIYPGIYPILNYDHVGLRIPSTAEQCRRRRGNICRAAPLNWFRLASGNTHMCWHGVDTYVLL